MKKKTVLTVAGAVGLSASALVAAGHYFYKTAVGINKKKFTEEYSMEEIYENDPWTDEKTWYNTANKERISIRSTDDLTLSGLFIPTKETSEKVAIIAHGYSGSNRDMAPWAKLYWDLGFNLLLPDARGHGDSDGDYIGFGWHERKDYLIWIDKMIEKLGSETKIVLFGLSMGAATVMNVSGENLPKNVKAIVADCGYSSVTEELRHQLKRMYKLPHFPLLNLTSFITKVKAGYWFEEANPKNQVQNSNTPILFIHGEKDEFVPTRMTYENYHAANSPKEIYIVPDAKHGYAYVTNKEEYRFRVKRFVEHFMK